MEQNEKLKITLPRWDEEAWAKRPAFNAQQAAYNVGRISNCFRFHAEQAFSFSLFGGNDQDVDHERRQAHTALLRLIDLASRLDHGNRSSPVENIQRLFSQKAATWLSDPVGDACREHAQGLKACSEDDGVPISIEALYKQMLEYATDVQIGDDLTVLCSWLTEESCDLIRVGTEVDLAVRPRDIYPYLFEISEPPQSSSGNDAAENEEDGRVENTASPYRCARHRTRGELPLDSTWNHRLRESLAVARICLNSALVDSTEQTNAQLMSLVDQLDADIWNRIDPGKPFWDASTRELTFRDELIKSLEGQAKAKDRTLSQELILGQFHQLGWPESVDISSLGIDLTPKEKKTRAYKIVSGLNVIRSGKKGTKSRAIPHMSFSTTDGGTRIRWEAQPASSTPE